MAPPATSTPPTTAHNHNEEKSRIMNPCCRMISSSAAFRWWANTSSIVLPQYRFMHTASRRAVINRQFTSVSTLQIHSWCCPPQATETKRFHIGRTELRRHISSNTNGSNDDLTGNPHDIITSTAATTEWKRNHYRKIGDKFQPNIKDNSDIDSSETTSSDRYPEPMKIDSYEDVQPMWKEMESRVTRRRSLTIEQRDGVSGRRNVRRSDEDVWLEAGVYDGGSKSPKGGGETEK